jgi:hypothetical protein
MPSARKVIAWHPDVPCFLFHVREAWEIAAGRKKAPRGLSAQKLRVARKVDSPSAAGRVGNPDHGEFVFTRPLVSGTAHNNVIANDNTVPTHGLIAHNRAVVEFVSTSRSGRVRPVVRVTSAHKFSVLAGRKYPTFPVARSSAEAIE